MVAPKKKFLSPSAGSESGPGRGLGNSRGSSALSNEFGKGIKVAPRSIKKTAAVKPKETVKIKSGGNIKPATPKKTIASHPSNVGKAPSPERVKWDLETAKLTARKGNKTVKIRSN